MVPAQGRSWGALGGGDVSSDLQASMYHKERSRLQVLLDLCSLNLYICICSPIIHAFIHPLMYSSLRCFIQSFAVLLLSITPPPVELCSCPTYVTHVIQVFNLKIKLLLPSICHLSSLLDTCSPPASPANTGHRSYISISGERRRRFVLIGTVCMNIAVICQLQEALARQHAMSAVSSSRAPADSSHRPASPWDSAWDQQSAAARDPGQGHQRQLHRQSQHNQGAFGSIVSDYRPAARLSPLQNRSDGVGRSHRYDM